MHGSSERNFAGEPSQRARVHSALDSVAKGAEHANELMKRLEDRLGSVLTPLPPAGTGDDLRVGPRVAPSPMADRVETLGDQIGRLAGQIEGILGRLEI